MIFAKSGLNLRLISSLKNNPVVFYLWGQFKTYRGAGQYRLERLPHFVLLKMGSFSPRFRAFAPMHATGA